MLGSVRHHFTVKQFLTDHEQPATFVLSQWQQNKTSVNLLYCLYRLGLFITIFVSWIFTFTTEGPGGIKPKWPIYLTNWGFTLCLIQTLLAGIMITGCLTAEKVPTQSHWKEKVLKLYSIYWVINIITTPLAFTITIIYWSLIYGSDPNASFNAMNFLVHAFNSIAMLLDLGIVAFPVKLLHFVYPVILAFVYSIFTIIYYLAGGVTSSGSPYIYPILKWDQPGKTTGVCAGVMILLILMHILAFFVYKMRIKIYEVYFLPRIQAPPPQKEQNVHNGFVNTAMANELV